MAAGDSSPLPSPFSQPMPFAGLWLEYWKLADAQGRAVLDWYSNMLDPVAARKRWLETMTEATDEYLRSPAFLDAMRVSSTAVAEVRTTQSQLVSDTVRACGLSSAGDVDALTERVRHAERSLARRLDEIEERLATMSDHRGTGQ